MLLRGQPAPHALDRDADLLAQLVAAGELGRRRAGAGRIGVGDGVHGAIIADLIEVS